MSVTHRLFLVVVCGAVAAVAAASSVTSARAAFGPPPGTPGSSPANPITQPGPPQQVRTYVDIFWTDGTTETVAADGPPSRALAAQVLADRAKAENRPLPPTSQRRLSRRSDDALAPDACSWSMSIWKLNFSEVRSNAAVYCTLGVTDVYGNLQLYRGASFILIGVDIQDGFNSANFTADGICANSTWQYNAYLGYTATNGSGGHDFGHWWGPQWITC